MKTHLNEKNNVHTKDRKLKQKKKSQDFVTKMYDNLSQEHALKIFIFLGTGKDFAKNIIVEERKYIKYIRVVKILVKIYRDLVNLENAICLVFFGK